MLRRGMGRIQSERNPPACVNFASLHSKENDASSNARTKHLGELFAHGWLASSPIALKPRMRSPSVIVESSRSAAIRLFKRLHHAGKCNLKIKITFPDRDHPAAGRTAIVFGETRRGDAIIRKR